MSLRPQIITKEVTIASASAGDTVLFRAPAAGRIVKVHGLRVGGTSSTVNAKIGATAVLAAAVTATTGTHASGVPSGVAGAAGGRFVAGDVISATLATAVGTPTVTVQVDMILASNTRVNG